MRRALRTPLAVVFGVLLVTSAALSGPGVQTAKADDWVESCHVGPVVVVAPAGTLCPDAPTEDLQKVDATETKKEIWSAGHTLKTQDDVYLTSLGNHLGDTKTIARMEGKNAYIRALNNESTKAEAEIAAREAIRDYYSVKQRNLIASWNTSLTWVNSSRQTLKNTSGTSGNYVDLPTSNNWLKSPTTSNYTLINQTDVQVLAYNWRKYNMNQNPTRLLTMTNGDQSTFESGTIKSLRVKPPTSDYESVDIVDLSAYKSRWEEIQSQEDIVQTEVMSFIDGTYEAYQAGEINNSDLVDPYLGAREYAPENGTNFDAYTLRSLAALGLDTPQNLSNVGRMNVTVASTGTTHTGILMADNTPEGGFAVGSTYNASNLDGHEFVALDAGGTQELTGEFTLQSAETATGETVATNETIEYNTVNYNTTNTTEYQELQTQLNNLTAQINARQQEIRNSGGGGGFLPDVNFGFGGAGLPVLIIAAGGAVLVLGRD